MYTQCLYCDALFRISAADLRAGQGKVRCGACNTVFNALCNLSDEPPAIPVVNERIALTPEAPQSGVREKAAAPPTLHAEALDAPLQPDAVEAAPRFSTLDTERPELSATPAEFTLSAAEGVGADKSQAIESTEPEAPLAPMAQKSYGWLSTGAWSLAIAGLIALLLAQYLYFARNELARHAELRPALGAFCSALNTIVPCAIALQRDIRRIEVENRTVQLHPGAPDALLIQLTLVNKARFAQPYPVLELSFTDLNANLIAQRRFQPGDYLEHGVSIADGMTPDIPLQVTLELAAPENGLNFELSSWNLALY